MRYFLLATLTLSLLTSAPAAEPVKKVLLIGMDGTRFDDRYSVAFVDNQRLQRIWFRDDKLKEGYRIRIEFISEKKTKAGASFVARAAQKVVLLLPEDEMAFRRAFNL